VGKIISIKGKRMEKYCVGRFRRFGEKIWRERDGEFSTEPQCSTETKEATEETCVF
jgi:hypothetical protein